MHGYSSSRPDIIAVGRGGRGFGALNLLPIPSMKNNHLYPQKSIKIYSTTGLGIKHEQLLLQITCFDIVNSHFQSTEGKMGIVQHEAPDLDENTLGVQNIDKEYSNYMEFEAQSYWAQHLQIGV